jgi:hypothetical protein
MTSAPPDSSEISTAKPTAIPGGSPIPAEGAVSEGFSRDLENARKSLSGLLGRVRRIRKEAAISKATRTVPSAELVTRLRGGLRKEHDYVLEPLLERLDAFATALNRGGDIPIPVIEEGLALVDRYLLELHDAHLRLLQITGVDPDKGAAGLLAFQQLASDNEHARVRWATVRVMLRGYEEKITGYRVMFAITLSQECRSERAWHDFEEEYVRTSVPAAFTPRVAETWQVELDRARAEGQADRKKIEDWVARTAAYVPGRA